VWTRRGVLAATFAVLFAPLIVVVVLSFNASRFGTLPFEFSLRWYGELFASDALFRSTARSLQLAGTAAVICAVLGTMVAIWMSRYAKRLVPAMNGALLSAVTIPWLILGIAMLTVFNAIGLGRSWTAMVLGSVATSLPYQVFIVVARLGSLDPALEDAARSLGASMMRTHRSITIPLLAPAILGGSLMAFTITFNNFVIQYFLAPFGIRTLPLEIFTLVRAGYRPDINALATIVLGATVVLILALQWTVGGVQRAIQPSED
jgi:ABC-type spermidine/putrescine transport system permease subunit II